MKKLNKAWVVRSTKRDGAVVRRRLDFSKPADLAYWQSRQLDPNAQPYFYRDAELLTETFPLNTPDSANNKKTIRVEKPKKLKTFRELIAEMERNETYQTRHVTLRDRRERRGKNLDPNTAAAGPGPDLSRPNYSWPKVLRDHPLPAARQHPRFPFSSNPKTLPNRVFNMESPNCPRNYHCGALLGPLAGALRRFREHRNAGIFRPTS